jgi:hypothetical protein
MLFQEPAQSKVIRKDELRKSPCFGQSEYTDVRWLNRREIGPLEDRFQPNAIESLWADLDTCRLEAGTVDPTL